MSDAGMDHVYYAEPCRSKWARSYKVDGLYSHRHSGLSSRKVKLLHGSRGLPSSRVKPVTGPGPVATHIVH